MDLMHLFLAAAFLIAAAPATAQDATIIVSGEALLETTPDQVRASMFLDQQANTYEEAVKGLNKRSKSIADDMAKEGFKPEEIKTSSFNISPNYEYPNGKQIQKGFRASQSLEIIFPYDVERLTRVVNRISSDGATPNFNVNFELSKKKQASLKQQLLEMAMEDAKSAATIIAATQGLQLDGFKEVRYGVNEAMPQPYLRAGAMMMKADAEDFAGFQPQDITLSERLQVVWKVK